MKKWWLFFLLMPMSLLMGITQSIAQPKPTWKQDSLRYADYMARGYKLGTAKRDSALLLLTKALQIAQQYKKKSQEVESLNQLGNLAAAYGERVEYYFKTLRLYEELNNARGIGETYLSLTEVVRLQSNNKYPKEVLEYAKNALNSFKKINDLNGCLRANNLIGVYYAMMGPKEQALPYFEDVKKNLIALKADSSRIMSAEYNIANFLSNYNPSESLKRRLAIYDYFKRNPKWIVGLTLLESFCIAYNGENNPNEVLKYATEGLQFAISVQNLGRQVSFNRHLYNAYKTLHDYEKALLYADKVRVLSDSVSKQQDAAKIAEAQQKYENEKKQTEIEKQRRELIEKQLSLEQATNQKVLLDRALALQNQQFATQKVQQQLKEVQFLNQNQQQKTRIQQLQVVNLKQANEKQQLINQQLATQARIWLGGGLGLTLLIVSGLLWRNRQLRQKNKEITAALLQGQTLERKRIAADLHDNLGSTISALGWSLGAIEKTNLSPKEQEVYQHVQNTIKQAYNQVRLLSHNLLPEELEKQGIWRALEQLIRKLNRNTSLQWTLQLPENPPRFDAKTEFELYSIILELTNNILKHAQATQASITFSIENENVFLVVSDNGRGIAENNTNGKGLQNIAERVASLNGTWEVTSLKEKGMRNEISVPV